MRLQLTRVDGTEHTYDVEQDHRGEWMWAARVVWYPWCDMRITRGGFTPEEGAAIRARLKQPHGRVCTVQLGGVR